MTVEVKSSPPMTQRKECANLRDEELVEEHGASAFNRGLEKFRPG